MIRALLWSRYIALVAMVLSLSWLIVWGKRVSYEQSINSFFADDDPDMRTYQKAAKVFGDDNLVFVMYEDHELISPSGIDRVAELAEAVGSSHIPGVWKVESLDAMPLVWKLDDALLAVEKLPALARNLALNTAKNSLKNVDLKSSPMTVGGAIRSGASDAAGLKALRDRLRHHPLFEGTVIDEQGTSTAIVVRLRKTHEHDIQSTVASLREIADAFATRHQLGRPAVVGPPVLLADGFSAIEIDGRRLAAVGMILIGIVTLTAVRSIWWAIIPMACGWLTWLATEHLLATYNIKLALSGGPLVAQIIVLTMPAASHLAIHFRDDRRKEADPRRAARSTLRAVALPIAWTAITGAIGYGALVTSDVVPIRQFGAILATCTLGSALLVVAISPVAMIPPFRMEIPVRLGSSSRTSSAMNRLVDWAYRNPKLVAASVFGITLPIALGIFRLDYETNFINLFRPQTRVVRDYQEVESKLGGIGLVELVVDSNGPLTPAFLEELQAVEKRVGLGSTPDARPEDRVRVMSLASVLDPDKRLAGLSEESRARVLTTKLDLIEASPQHELLRGFWNPGAKQSRIMVRLREQQPAPTKARIFAEAEQAVQAELGPSSYLTGLSFLMTKTTQAVIATQWGTFCWSAIGILLMLTIAFRSPVLALLALLPTLLSVALVLGLMGWLGIRLDMATALVASVALGLSVDDTFHCLSQFRRERATRSFRERLFDGYTVSGPGVLLSSLAVTIGFAALRLSEFEPFVNFGTMVGIATAGSTLGNLVLLPGLLTLGHRWKTKRLAERPSVAAIS